MFAVIDKKTTTVLRTCNTKETAIIAAQLEKDKLPSNERHQITAVALDDDTVLLEIKEDNLKEYFLAEPEKLLLLMRNLSGRLREMNDKLADVCRKIYEIENA